MHRTKRTARSGLNADRSTPGHRQDPSAGKLERVVRAVIHRIGTGALRAGDRLPSVRQAEAEFDVARLTALAAYRRLVELALVEAKPRSGFVVAANPRIQSVRERGAALDTLLDDVVGVIRRESGGSVAATLQCLAELAAARARLEPEVAFIECSRHQAEAHAAEITKFTRMPCLPLVLDRGGVRHLTVPRHVRKLVTTAFHRKEVTAIGRKDLAVIEVPIEIDPAFLDRIESAFTRDPRPGSVAFLGLAKHVIGPVVEDVATRVGKHASRVRKAYVDEVPIERLDAVLNSVLERRDAPSLIVLSSTLWDNRPNRSLADPRLVPVTYRIAAEAWMDLTDSLGLPLGRFTNG